MPREQIGNLFYTDADEKNEGDVDDDDDDSDDDVNVVIGDIKTSTSYSSLNIKRGGLLTSASIDKIGGKVCTFSYFINP